MGANGQSDSTAAWRSGACFTAAVGVVVITRVNSDVYCSLRARYQRPPARVFPDTSLVFD